MEPDPLEQLRDIHLPEAVSIWPLAPGWWILAACTLLASGVLVWCLYRRRVSAYRRVALFELEARYQEFQHSDNTLDYISANQAILRRAALHHYPQQRAAIASLSGAAWINFLDSCVKKALFANQFGEQLGEAHYRREPSIEPTELHLAAVQWLKQHK